MAKKNSNNAYRINNANQLKQLLQLSTQRTLTDTEYANFDSILTSNVPSKEFSLDELVKLFIESQRNGHVGLLEKITMMCSSERIFSVVDHADSKEIKQQFLFALINSGFVKLGGVHKYGLLYNGDGEYDVRLQLATQGDTSFTCEITDVNHWQLHAGRDLVYKRLNFFFDDPSFPTHKTIDEMRMSKKRELLLPQDVHSTPALPASRKQYTVKDLYQAYGLGIAANVAHASVWHGHEERFVELLGQLPEHIAQYYVEHAIPWLSDETLWKNKKEVFIQDDQLPEAVTERLRACCASWLLPHMLTRDEVNDRPAPLKDWVAKVSANENRAPTADAVVARGGV